MARERRQNTPPRRTQFLLLLRPLRSTPATGIWSTMRPVIFPFGSLWQDLGAPGFETPNHGDWGHRTRGSRDTKGAGIEAPSSRAFRHRTRLIHWGLGHGKGRKPLILGPNSERNSDLKNLANNSSTSAVVYFLEKKDA